jgi:hypothetical protein
MGVLGRYTSYVGGGAATAAHGLLAKLFPAGQYAKQVANGDEKAAQAVAQTTATAKVAAGVGGLQPSDGIQAGDLGMFPAGVDLTFAYAVGQTPPNAPPDVSKVKWTRPGDPANPFTPDITSPGPGRTDGTDKNVDPKIAAADINPAPSIADTRDPSNEGTAVSKNNAIGAPQKLGDSGGNV